MAPFLSADTPLPGNDNEDIGKLAAAHCGERWRWSWFVCRHTITTPRQRDMVVGQSYQVLSSVQRNCLSMAFRQQHSPARTRRGLLWVTKQISQEICAARETSYDLLEAPSWDTCNNDTCRRESGIMQLWHDYTRVLVRHDAWRSLIVHQHASLTCASPLVYDPTWVYQAEIYAWRLQIL